MGVQLVVVRLRGLWSDDEASWSVVWGEIDDVEEPRESGVLAVIVVCMEKEFCGPCRVSWMTEIEEGGAVVAGGVVKVGGAVCIIVGSGVRGVGIVGTI